VAKVKVEIKEAAGDIASIEDQAERLQVVLAVYAMAGAPKRLLAQSVGMNCNNLKFMTEGATRELHCASCGEAVPTTRSNYNQSRVECDACINRRNSERRQIQAQQREEYERQERDKIDQQEAMADFVRVTLDHHRALLSPVEIHFLIGLRDYTHKAYSYKQVRWLDRIVDRVRKTIERDQPKEKEEGNVIQFPSPGAA
jgi:hypothetical protein